MVHEKLMVLLQIGLDRNCITDPITSKTLRIYPLDSGIPHFDYPWTEIQEIDSSRKYRTEELVSRLLLAVETDDMDKSCLQVLLATQLLLKYLTTNERVHTRPKKSWDLQSKHFSNLLYVDFVNWCIDWGSHLNFFHVQLQFLNNIINSKLYTCSICFLNMLNIHVCLVYFCYCLLANI